MKICDLTQFYSPLSGGVKRYVHEKIAYVDKHSPNDEHVLIVPGPKTEVTTKARSRIYSVHSPLVSRRLRYRALLNLRTVEEILERERPDIIESSDPYQVGWKSIASGRALGIPVVGFYHSHFAEAHLRSATKYLGKTATEAVMDFAMRYVRNLYNKFEVTLVPSENLAQVLRGWGVRNVRVVKLGVNIDIFNRKLKGEGGTRASLGIASDQKMLLYVGRLANEKNTQVLFEAIFCTGATLEISIFLLLATDRSASIWRNYKNGLTARYRGCVTAQIRPNSPGTIVRLICLFIPASRKHLASSRWKARPAARRSLGFAVVTWTGSFFTNRNRGRAKTRRKLWPTPLTNRAQRCCRSWARTRH